MSSTPLILLFHVIVVLALVIDFKYSGQGTTKASMRSSILWTLTWIALSLAFAGLIFMVEGLSPMLDFLAAYTIEKALSVDNLFVFLIIFESFSLTLSEERRVLFWGVMGSIVLRVVFIIMGLALFAQFSWLFYIFGVVLMFAGFKMFAPHKAVDHQVMEEHSLLKFAKKILPMGESRGLKMMTWRPHFTLTPLFLVILMVAWTDLIFAIDSIPAVLSITNSLTIAYTSNIFAVLGLRSLFFVIRSFKESFKYVQISVAVITVFVGVKMLLLNVFHIPISLSLSFIFVTLVCGVVASIVLPQQEQQNR